MFSDGRPLGAFIKQKDSKEQHKDRRYSCNICQKYYSNETGYLKHMALHPEMVCYISLVVWSVFYTQWRA